VGSDQFQLRSFTVLWRASQLGVGNSRDVAAKVGIVFEWLQRKRKLIISNPEETAEPAARTFVAAKILECASSGNQTRDLLVDAGRRAVIEHFGTFDAVRRALASDTRIWAAQTLHYRTKNAASEYWWLKIGLATECSKHRRSRFIRCGEQLWSDVF
jgi:hypothetical protein